MALALLPKPFRIQSSFEFLSLLLWHSERNLDWILSLTDGTVFILVFQHGRPLCWKPPIMSLISLTPDSDSPLTNSKKPGLFAMLNKTLQTLIIIYLLVSVCTIHILSIIWIHKGRSRKMKPYMGSFMSFSIIPRLWWKKGCYNIDALFKTENSQYLS